MAASSDRSNIRTRCFSIHLTLYSYSMNLIDGSDEVTISNGVMIPSLGTFLNHVSYFALFSLTLVNILCFLYKEKCNCYVYPINKKQHLGQVWAMLRQEP